MVNIIRKTALAAGFALVALGLTAASAATVTSTSAALTSSDAGYSWTVDFICSPSLPCNASPTVELTARAVFTLTTVVINASTVSWGINLVLTNTSASGVGGALTAMGFNTDPDAVLSGIVDSAADGTVFSGGSGGAAGIPGYQTELCVWDGNNCQAANEKTMTAGEGNTMSFILTTAGLGTLLTFDNFAVKVAGAGLPQSYEFGGTIPAPVPLPAAGGFLLLGLGALVALRRKQKSA